MCPSSVAEPRPSRLSTVAFALLSALVVGTLGAIFGTFHEDTLPPVMDADGALGRPSVAGWWGLAAGVMGAAIAGWAWRSPREKRFHIAFLSGLICLIAAAAYVGVTQAAFSRGDLMPAAAGQDGYWNTWGTLHLMAQGPVVTWFVATLGLVLILGALIQDR